VEACEELDKPKPIEEGEVNGQTSAQHNNHSTDVEEEK